MRGIDLYITHFLLREKSYIHINKNYGGKKMKKKILLVAVIMVCLCIPYVASAEWYGDLWYNVNTINNETFVSIDGCNKEAESLLIPSTINGIPVKGTNNYYACQGCKNLKTLTISEGVKVLAGGAFRNCPQLKTVNLPSTITKIDFEAFSGCTSLENITIPKDTVYVDMSAFDGCSKNFKISVDSRNPYFSLKDDVLFHLENGINTLVSYPYSKTDKTYSIPDDVTQINQEAFKNDNLENCIIPDGIKILGDGIFFNCSALKTVTIPVSVNSIYQYAFSKSLKDIYYEGNEDEWNNIIVTIYNETGPISTPIKDLPDDVNFLNGVTIHFAEPVQEPSFVVSNSKITNTSDSEQTAIVIVAKYNSNKTLQTILSQKVTFAANESKSFNVSGNYKIFVWNSLSKMKSLTIQ